MIQRERAWGKGRGEEGDKRKRSRGGKRERKGWSGGREDREGFSGRQGRCEG